MFKPPIISNIKSGFNPPINSLNDGLSMADIIWYVRSPGLVDSVGLSIETLYPLLDATLQSIVSADGGTTRRTDAEIYALARVSEYLNMGEMIGRGERGIAVYADGTDSAVLLKACRYFDVVYGEQFYATDLDGKSVFGTPDIGAYEYA